jgi:hypothetical protein
MAKERSKDIRAMRMTGERKDKENREDEDE